MIEDKMRKGVILEKGGYLYNKKKVEHLLKIPIKDIRLAHMQDVIDRYADMSHTTLVQIKTAMKATFDAAIKNDIVDKNYAALVTLPQKVKSEIHKPFTPVEISRLWELAKADRDARILLVYIYSGMRPGEIQGIKLKDVYIKDRYMIGGSKTAAGKNRIIPIAESILPFIKEWYKLSNFQRHEYLLPKDTPKHLLVAIRTYLNKHFPGHLPHDGRHTCATLLIHIGISEATTKTILGHRHSDVTNQVYIHKDVSELVAAVNKLPDKDILLCEDYVSLTFAKS